MCTCKMDSKDWANMSDIVESVYIVLFEKTINLWSTSYNMNKPKDLWALWANSPQRSRVFSLYTSNYRDEKDATKCNSGSHNFILFNRIVSLCTVSFVLNVHSWQSVWTANEKHNAQQIGVIWRAYTYGEQTENRMSKAFILKDKDIKRTRGSFCWWWELERRVWQL